MKSISNLNKNIATFVAIFFLTIPMFFSFCGSMPLN